MQITLDEQGNKFLTIVDGEACILSFRKISSDTWEYDRTFVPQNLRGRGIASHLAKFALDHAQKHNLKIIPTCGFISDFIEHNDKYKYLVKSGA